MKIKKVHLKNIRSYQSQSIEFPEGSLLLAGDVGSGKTTLLLAIEYALFGLQPGQKGSALLRHDATLGEVMLECEIDGHEVIIERHLKRENRSIVSDYAALTLDGEMQEYSVTELKTKILALLGYPAEFVKRNNILYRYTVYTPQEQMKQIIIEDTETRLNVLRHIFGIDKYKRIRENLTLLINRLKEEAKILQGEVKTIEYDKIRLATVNTKSKELVVNIEKQEKVWKECITQRKALEFEIAEVEKSLKEKEKFEKEVEKTTILIALKQENLATFAREQRELAKLLASSGKAYDESQYTTCTAALTAVKEELVLLNRKTISFMSNIASLERAQLEFKAKKERIFKIDMCPTCLQDVPDAHKHNILNEAEGKLVDIKKQLEIIREQQDSLTCVLEEKKSSTELLEKQKVEWEILRSKIEYIENSRKKLSEITKQQETLQRDIEFLQQHTNSLKGEILSFSKFDTHSRLKQEELKKAFLTEKNAEIGIAELRKELEISLEEISRVQAQIVQKELLEDKLRRLLEVVDWLSNQFIMLIDFTEIQVMMKLRREFSRVFSSWFHMIAGDAFEVQLDENFTPVIMQGDFEMDYSFLSGGERTAVALAYRLALNQTINSVLSQIKTSDIVILDEPTDGFSEGQIDKIRDVLEELRVEQLIIVSHEQKIESFVDNIIRLRKTGDVSEVDTSAHSPSTAAPRDG